MKLYSIAFFLAYFCRVKYTKRTVFLHLFTIILKRTYSSLKTKNLRDCKLFSQQKTKNSRICGFGTESHADFVMKLGIELTTNRH